MPKGYTSSNTSVHFMNYHFVWCPKYRRKVIIADVEARLHEIIRDTVRGNNWEIIALEDLNIAGMVKNRHLAKSIGDASWNRIVQYTMYKAESAGAVVVSVNPMHTSQKCSKCGSIRKDLKLSDRIYHCDACGLTMDRDLNAAINIERKGIEKLKELINVGRGTPEVTPVEIGSIPARANPVAESGSPLR